MENANLSTSFKHHFWNIDKESWCVVFFSNNESWNDWRNKFTNILEYTKRNFLAQI